MAAWMVVVGTGKAEVSGSEYYLKVEKMESLMDWMWGVREREEQGNTSSPFSSFSSEAPTACLLKSISPSTILTNFSYFPSLCALATFWVSSTVPSFNHSFHL